MIATDSLAGIGARASFFRAAQLAMPRLVGLGVGTWPSTSGARINPAPRVGRARFTPVESPFIAAAPSTDLAGAPFKEWLHFNVLGDDLDLLLNLSVSASPGPGPGGATAAADVARGAVDGPPEFVGRVVALARSRGRWSGGVQQVPASALSLTPGEVDARFADTWLRCEEGAFELQVAPEGVPIRARLRLEPLAMSLLRPRTSLGHGQINWLTIPRLVAHGTVTVGDDVHVLRGSPAYHDHNWGSWRWGQDFFWQWAVGLSDASAADATPWTFVFYRILDRGRVTERARALLVWRGPHLVRAFRDEEVDVSAEGFLRAGDVPKFPPVMALVAPELSTDVPAELRVRARDATDELRVRFSGAGLAQLLVPSEVDLGALVINEISGAFSADGRVANADVAVRGRSFHEHVTVS